MSHAPLARACSLCRTSAGRIYFRAVNSAHEFSLTQWGQSRRRQLRQAENRTPIFLAEVLTGRRPFIGRTLAELIAAILHAPYHLPGDAPEVRHLGKVLQRCLAKDRRQCIDLTASLQQVLIPAIEHCPPFAPAAASSNDMIMSEDTTRSLPT